jgi:micrococcal nuclease
VKVIKIIDGDTIQIEGGRKLRYIGMDTPETVDPRKKVQCFGNEASLRNKDLVLGKQVFLERDISETDKFGRLLRYVYVANQENQQIMINEQLVREGYAYASSYPPDIKYQEKLQAAEREARENKRGLWSTCTIKN